ncbi:hypothetical protein KJY78_05475 [Canibacter sp. lx-45]|uniref:DUF5719 family protein n=1 Tax=Canibacter zhuwentaonis TaxID=2837491 RepID=UPI001BDD6D83|nr:DUF5719 family protein [Canibacter zhuwentaonis]MBT1035793.1 hypothetical protein [Canibacter zhuwentaonis]
MTSRARATIYTGRALTGTVVSAVAVAGIIAATTISAQYPQQQVRGIPVDISGTTNTRIACSGGFAELGTNPSDLTASSAHSGQEVSATRTDAIALERSNGEAASYATAFRAPGSTKLAAAQTQTLATEQLRGVAAHSCTAPATDQWIVGGKTELNSNATLTLSNPGDKDAAVSIRAYNSTGEITGTKAVGALVPAKQSRTISVNGIAPNSPELALRVQANGAAVSAVLGVAETHDIRPQGIDTITAQGLGDRVLTLPNVRNNYDSGNNDAAAGDSSILAQVMALQADGHATVYAVSAAGTKTEVGKLKLEQKKLTPLKIEPWKDEYAALQIAADTPIVGAAVGNSFQTGNADMVWFTPSPPLSGEHYAAIVSGGSLTVQAGNAPSEVTVKPLGSSAAQTVKLKANEIKKVALSVNTVSIKSDALVYAAVTIFTPAGGAAYPVTTVPSHRSQVLVYTN